MFLRHVELHSARSIFVPASQTNGCKWRLLLKFALVSSTITAPLSAMISWHSPGFFHRNLRALILLGSSPAVVHHQFIKFFARGESKGSIIERLFALGPIISSSPRGEPNQLSPSLPFVALRNSDVSVVWPILASRLRRKTLSFSDTIEQLWAPEKDFLLAAPATANNGFDGLLPADQTNSRLMRPLICVAARCRPPPPKAALNLPAAVGGQPADSTL